MMRFSLLASWSLAGLVSALPSAPNLDKRYSLREGETSYTVFEHAATKRAVKYVTNSGVCETTPGVNQYSGYLSVGTNMNMWFWFFEARNSPSTAPLAIWLNGGPGCSSMIGLFQENGPCHFVGGSSTPSLNPYSWNTYANMLYVDQPIGTGFSYGTDDVTSTVTAAPEVWNLVQAFYAAFPQYQSREFGIFTESYGGHYGPEFARYFESQNAKIAAGTLTGLKINLVALGVNNGWIDPGPQFKAYVDYSYNNTYKQLITKSQYNSYINAYNTKCAPQMAKCPGTTGTDSACLNADDACNNAIYYPLASAADFDVYDIRQPSNDPNPPETYVAYLQSSSVMAKIGAQATYQECPNGPYTKIVNTGDDARSFLGSLSTVVQSGINVMIWAGDADWICNWIGNLVAANAITYPQSAQFNAAAVKPYTVGGVAKGEFKVAGNLNWLRVFEAGHEVPYYQPETGLQAFWQIMQKKPLAST